MELSEHKEAPKQFAAITAELRFLARDFISEFNPWRNPNYRNDIRRELHLPEIPPELRSENASLHLSTASTMRILVALSAGIQASNTLKQTMKLPNFPDRLEMFARTFRLLVARVAQSLSHSELRSVAIELSPDKVAPDFLRKAAKQWTAKDLTEACAFLTHLHSIFSKLPRPNLSPTDIVAEILAFYRSKTHGFENAVERSFELLGVPTRYSAVLHTLNRTGRLSSVIRRHGLSSQDALYRISVAAEISEARIAGLENVGNVQISKLPALRAAPLVPERLTQCFRSGSVASGERLRLARISRESAIHQLSANRLLSSVNHGMSSAQRAPMGDPGWPSFAKLLSEWWFRVRK